MIPVSNFCLAVFIAATSRVISDPVRLVRNESAKRATAVVNRALFPAEVERAVHTRVDKSVGNPSTAASTTARNYATKESVVPVPTNPLAPVSAGRSVIIAIPSEV